MTLFKKDGVTKTRPGHVLDNFIWDDPTKKIIGKTIKKIELACNNTGERNVWCFVFTDNTFIAITAEDGPYYDLEPFTHWISHERELSFRSLSEHGIIPKEVYKKKEEKDKKELEERTRQRELMELERLKEKYEK